MSTSVKDHIADTVAHLPPLATPKEAAELLRCSDRTIRRMLADGRISHFRERHSGASHVLIPRLAIEAWLRKVAA